MRGVTGLFLLRVEFELLTALRNDLYGATVTAFSLEISFDAL